MTRMHSFHNRIVHLLSGHSGQMSVELAVVLPIVIAAILVCYNAGRYLMLCAQFDRLAQNAVIVHGVAPSGEQSVDHAVAEIQQEITKELPHQLVSVEVEAGAPERDASRPLTFFISPLLTRYTCVMKYKPWPLSFACAGVSLSFDLGIEHKKSLVVDRFRTKVVA